MQEVTVDYLPRLNEAVEELITRPSFHQSVNGLKEQLEHTSEPFVWATVEPHSITVPLPESIKSCWIFVLKRDIPSGCHYHPNSIQHMVMIEGAGTSRIGTTAREMKRLGERGSSLDDVWYVIREGVPHEFFPSGADVVVVSFHTCASDELEEISCDSGAARNYEPPH